MSAKVRRLARLGLTIGLVLAPVVAPGRSAALGLAEPTLRIHDIQGAGHRSAHVGEPVPDVPGVVTAIRSDGFYLQDPQPDADPATSEGIFVFTAGPPTVAVGDSLLVSGTVEEFRPGGDSGQTNLTTTELVSPSIVTQSKANALPPPVVIGPGGRVPPTTVIEDDATGDAETSGVFDPQTDGLDFYESLEGMRVQVNDAVVVGPTRVFGSGGSQNAEVVVLADGGRGSGLRTPRGGILARATTFNPERIILNDLLVGGPRLPTADVGDTLPGPTVGIIDYTFGNYKLEVAAVPSLVAGGLARTIAAPAGLNELSVATFNVENLSPRNGPDKFARLAGLIVDNLAAPDLIAVEEIQDNDGPTDDGVVDASTTYATLLAAIVAAGGPQYEVRQIDPVDDQDGGQPGGNIRQGFLFRTDRGLAFVDRPGGTSTTPTALVDVKGAVRLSASPGRIEPAHPAWTASRKPLAGEFSYAGQTLFVIANHLVAKAGDDPLFGSHQPPVEATRSQRVQQAQVLHDFVAALLGMDESANVLVLGDLNDFPFSEALAVLTGADDPEPVLHDLIDTLPENERYSYDFEGNSEALDHILASPHLRPAASLEPIHVNAEFADQASDHDPLLTRITLPARP